MLYFMEEMEDIEQTSGIRLRQIGIVTTDDLLTRCGQANGRKVAASASGLTEHDILKWVARADLMRVPGIGHDYAKLLTAAGVDTAIALSLCEPAVLAASLKRVNSEQRLTRSVPSQNRIAGWIDHARQLEPIVSDQN